MRNVASERVRKGMSQDELASALSVNRVTVARWESGSVTPRPEQVCKMADLFGCSTDYLLERTEERVVR